VSAYVGRAPSVTVSIYVGHARLACPTLLRTTAIQCTVAGLKNLSQASNG